MEKLKMCRICLVENVRMHLVTDRHLREIFEKLTNISFQTEDSRPMLACFFCYARLKQCYKFRQKCLEAEAVFTQMLDDEYEKKPIQADLEFFGGFLKTPTVQVSIEDRQQEDDREDKEDINEELTSDCEITDDVEIKSEYHSDGEREDKEDIMEKLTSDCDITDNGEFEFEFYESEKEPKNYSYPGFENNPLRIVFQSDSEDDIPITRMKTGVEQDKKKRRATTKERGAREKSASVAKKPKLHENTIRNEKLEDTIPTKDKKSEQTNAKVIHRTKSSKLKSETEVIEPIKSNPIINPVITKCFVNMNTDNAAICTNHSNNINNDCLKCNYRGINSDDVKNHGLNHSNLSKEKSHKCYVCQTSFKLKHHLKRHIRIHTGEKPYECDVCHRSYGEKDRLITHIRIHTGEKPYKCDTCQRRFTDKRNLHGHTRTHTGERPHKCYTCQHSFGTKRDYNRHILIHTDENPHKCDFCLSSFKQLNSLTAHIRKHMT